MVDGAIERTQYVGRAAWAERREGLLDVDVSLDDLRAELAEGRDDVEGGGVLGILLRGDRGVHRRRGALDAERDLQGEGGGVGVRGGGGRRPLRSMCRAAPRTVSRPSRRSASDAKPWMSWPSTLTMRSNGRRQSAAGESASTVVMRFTLLSVSPNLPRVSRARVVVRYGLARLARHARWGSTSACPWPCEPCDQRGAVGAPESPDDCAE